MAKGNKINKGSSSQMHKTKSKASGASGNQLSVTKMKKGKVRKDDK